MCLRSCPAGLLFPREMLRSATAWLRTVRPAVGRGARMASAVTYHGVAGQAMRRGCGTSHLTSREVEVLRLAAMGLFSYQIARQLVISRRTVDDHLKVARRRVGARNTSELIARCYAVEILVGWPPHWSGRCCMPMPRRSNRSFPDVEVGRSATPPASGSAEVGQVSESATTSAWRG